MTSVLPVFLTLDTIDTFTSYPSLLENGSLFIPVHKCLFLPTVMVVPRQPKGNSGHFCAIDKYFLLFTSWVQDRNSLALSLGSQAKPWDLR